MKHKEAVILAHEIADDDEFSPNAWESDFLESIDKVLDQDRDLSPAQGETLERIYRKSKGG